jgi:hypothetical protein
MMHTEKPNINMSGSYCGYLQFPPSPTASNAGGDICILGSVY